MIGDAIAGASATMGAINQFDIELEMMSSEMNTTGAVKAAAAFSQEQMKVEQFILMNRRMI